MEKAIVMSEKEFRNFVTHNLIELFVADVIAGYVSEEDFIKYATNIVKEWIENKKVDGIVVLGQGYDLGNDEYKQIKDGEDFRIFVKNYYESTLDDLLKEKIEEIKKLKKR